MHSAAMLCKPTQHLHGRMWLIFELSVALNLIQCPSSCWSAERFEDICTLCAIPEEDRHAHEHRIPLSATLDSILRPARSISCRQLEPPLVCKSNRSVETLQYSCFRKGFFCRQLRAVHRVLKSSYRKMWIRRSLGRTEARLVCSAGDAI